MAVLSAIAFVRCVQLSRQRERTAADAAAADAAQTTAGGAPAPAA
jgi:hypothetical protein